MQHSRVALWGGIPSQSPLHSVFVSCIEVFSAHRAGSWGPTLEGPKGQATPRKGERPGGELRHVCMGVGVWPSKLALALLPLRLALGSGKLFVNGTVETNAPIQTNASAPPCSYKRVNPSFPSFYLGTVHPVRKDLKIPSIEPGGLRRVEASDLGLGWGRELSGLPW